MTQFATKQFEGQTYTFSHLQPMTLNLEFKVNGEPHPLAVEVTFGCHCFTDTFDEAVHGDHHRYTHGHETRAFDLERYQCSLELPAVISSIVGGTIYRSQDNYTYVSRIRLQSQGRSVDYSLFFSLTKPEKATAAGPATRPTWRASPTWPLCRPATSTPYWRRRSWMRYGASAGASASNYWPRAW